MAADVLAVRLWWFEERGLKVVCQVVKRLQCINLLVASQTEDFRRSLRVLICCVDFLCL